MATIKAVHYLNQFFGGVGGEDQAGVGPSLVPGPKGPGLLLQQLAPEIEVVATIVAGDDYMAERGAAAVEAVLALISDTMSAGEPPQLMVAGPAFIAGRYGMACGAVCKAVGERLGIPAVTAMHPENPGVASYRGAITIVEAARDVMGMKPAVEAIAHVGPMLVRGEAVDPDVDGTLTRGLRRNEFAEVSGAERAVAMLLRKMGNEPFETEYAMPVFDRVMPAPAVDDLSHCRLALVTTGGIVPRGNPDRIRSADAARYGAYEISGVETLTSDTYATVHGGYDPTFATADPNRVLPLDVVRDLEREGKIGTLHDVFFTTVGNATSVAHARAFGEAIAARLRDAGVQAVILTST